MEKTFKIGEKTFVLDEEKAVQAYQEKKVINGHMTKLIQDLQAAGYKGDTLVRRLAAIWYSGDGTLMNNKTKQYYNGREYPSIYDYTMDILARVKRGT